MRLSVATKIFLGFAVVLCTFGGVSIYGIVQMHRIGEGLTLVNAAYVPLAKLVAQVETVQKDRVRDTDRLLEEKDLRTRRALIQLARVYFPRIVQEKLRSAREIAKAAHGLGDELDRKLLSDVLAGLDAIEARYAEYDQAAAALYAALEGSPGAPPDLEALSRALGKTERRVEREVALLGRALESSVAERVRAAEREENTTAWAIVALTLSAILVGMLATWLSARMLAPIRRLTEAAKSVGRGELGMRVEPRAEDEVGVLAREFNAMAKSLAEQRQALVRGERLAAIGRIAAHITHEIRNPLNSIGLDVEMLEEAVGDDPEVRALVRAIVREVDRLTEITEEYLRFARLPRPALGREDAAGICEGLLDFMAGELAAAKVTVERRFEPGLPPVLADENQLRAAFLNLVRNAREAMNGGGRLTVSARAADGFVELRFADTGPGIPPEVTEKIFDPFFTTKEKGTGLGLALTQQIVQEHGGSLAVESRPGQGTEFVVRLPRAPQVAAGALTASAPPPPPAARRA